MQVVVQIGHFVAFRRNMWQQINMQHTVIEFRRYWAVQCEHEC